MDSVGSEQDYTFPVCVTVKWSLVFMVPILQDLVTMKAKDILSSVILLLLEGPQEDLTVCHTVSLMAVHFGRMENSQSFHCA